MLHVQCSQTGLTPASPEWCVTHAMSECMCVPAQDDGGHSLGGGDPLTKFKRQMSLTTKGCITPSGMEEELRFSGATYAHMHTQMHLTNASHKCIS